MNDRFREILDSLPDARSRSRLEPYKELIQELRHRKRPYREIVRVLATNCGVRVSHSTLHEFVQRYLAKKSAPSATPKPQPRSKPKAHYVYKRATFVQPEAMERIKELRRKSVPLPNESTQFEFDCSEPLRLRPEKT